MTDGAALDRRVAVQILSILIDQANVLEDYISGKGSISNRMRRPRCKETYQQ